MGVEPRERHLRIRGTFLKDYVKIVKATRDQGWERFLTDDDWEIIDTMVIPAQWYPAETMGRIAEGLYSLLSGESSEFIRQFGENTAPDYFADVKSFLSRDDVPQALDKWRWIADRFVDEISVSVVEVSDKRALVSFFPVDGAPSFAHYREVMAGNLLWLVKANGGANPGAEFESGERDGREELFIELSWE